MSMEVGRIDLGLDVNQSYFNRQMRGLSSGAERSVMSAFGGLGTKIGVALGVAAVTSFAKSCLDLGSDLAEVQNVVDTTFTSMADQVNSFANSAIDTFGLSETVTKKYMGTLGTMSKSMGMTESVAYDMAEAITGLSGDVASFYNLSSDEAYTKLKSIWTGETESLKDLGIVMTQTALDQYALNNGFGKTTAKMTEQEKLMLRYQYVMSGLSAAQGDFVKTQDGWANQTRVLSLRFDQLKATLGQGLINALLPVIKLLNGIIERLQVAANAFVDFTKVIFGIKDATSSSGSSTGGMLDGVTDSANAASEAIASTNKQLAGFDKINNTGSSDSNSGGSGSGITIPSVGDFESVSSDEIINNSTMVKWLDTVVEKLGPAQTALSGLYDDAIKPLINFTGTALFDFYDKFLKPVGGWVLGTGLPGLVDACTNLFKFIDWDKMNDALSDLWTALAPFATAVGEGLVSFLKDASLFVGKGLGDLFGLLSSGVKSLSGVIGGADSNLIEATGKAIGTLAGAVLLFSGASKLGGILNGVGSGVGKILQFVSKYKGIFSIVSGPVIAQFISNLFDSVSSAERNALNDAISDLNLSMNDLDEALERARSNYSSIDTQNRSMEIAVDAYFKLANKKILTSEEQGLLKTYAKLLTENFAGLDDVIDTHTGAYKGTEKEIRNMIRAHQAYVLQVASEDASVEITKKALEAKVNYEKLQVEYYKAKERLGKQIDELPGWLKSAMEDNTPFITGVAQTMLSAARDDVDKAGNALSAAYKNLEQAEADQKWYMEQSAKYAQEYTSLINQEITSLSTGTETSLVAVTKAFAGLPTGIKSSSAASKNILKSGLDGMSLLLDNYYDDTKETVGKIKSTLSGMATSIAGKVSESIKTLNSLGNKVSSTQALQSSMSVLSGVGAITALSGIPKLASGGYVKANTPQLAMIGDNRHQGEVVAPEDKLLEMAIAAAKASGSSKENLEMISILRDMLNALIKLGDKELVARVLSSDIFNSVKNEATSYTKKTGKPAFV